MPLTIRCPNPACLRDLVVPDRAPPPAACLFCGVLFSAAETLAAAPNRTVPPQRPTTPPANPTRIGRFELRKKLGAGAFGTVYTAHDPQLDRAVALKVPNAAVVSAPGRVERFVREAKAVANLRHPNIVPVFEAGQDGGRYFIASALIDGQPLSDAIPDGGADFRQAAERVRQLADALAYAHSEGVVHRDVKPANVILDRKGNVHLTDFGLARRSGDSALPSGGSGTPADGRLTNDGDIVGTPAYMAPEQAAGKGGEVGPAADQYALGVVLYELIAGQIPFGGPPAVVIAALLTSDPPPPSKHRRGVPKDLEAICRRAMKREPGERYQSCRHLADDLRRFLDGDPIASRELTDLERMFLWARRRPTAAGASVLGVVVVVLIVSISVAAGLASLARQGRGFAEAERDAAYRERDAAHQSRDAMERDRDERRRERDDLERLRDKMARDRDAEKLARVAAEAARDQALRDKVRARGGVVRAYAQALTVLGQNAPSSLPAGWDGAFTEMRGWEWDFVRNPRVREYPPRPDPDAAGGWRSEATLVGHTGGVLLAAFAPDGRRVVTGSFDKTARVWDAATGKEIAAFQTHRDLVVAAAFSPDGRRVVTGSWDGTARVWDATTAKELTALTGHEGSVYSAVFSPDGRHVVTGSDKTARVWDVATGKELAARPGRVAAFAPDGRGVVSGSWDGIPRVWDVATGKELAAFKGHTAYVASAAFAPDGRRVVTASDDKTARVWDGATRAVIATLNGHSDGVTSAAFAPDGRRVVTGSSDGTARVWDAATGKELAVLMGHTKTVTSAAFSPDGRHVVTGTSDTTARVWDAATGKQVADFTRQTGILASAAFSPDGRRVVTGGGRTAQVWSEVTRRAVGVRFRLGGARLLVVAETGAPWEVKIPSMEIIPESQGPIPPARATHPDNSRQLIVAGGLVRLRDVETGVEVFTLPQTDAIDATFSPDGHWIATVGKDGSVRLYDGRPNPAPAKSP